MSKYNVGDQVRIINHRGKGWNSYGLMDKYKGKVLTIMDIEEFPEIGNSLYTMEECPMFVFSDEDIVELVSSPADIKPTEPTKPANNTEEENDMNATETKKIKPIDAPFEFNEELATITAFFTDEVLKVADKYNLDQREVMTIAAKAVTHSAEDDFFWDFIVPMQAISNKMREKTRK